MPPRREDFNGLFYILSSMLFYFQHGGFITFNSDVSDKIGGYPQGCMLDYYDGSAYSKVVSLIDDNTYNFVENPDYLDGEHWQLVTAGGADVNLSNLSESGEAHFANPGLSNLSDEGVEYLDTNYLPLAGNSEDTPVTGTIYISKGNGNIIRYHDTDLNVTDMETPSSAVYPMGIYCYDTDDYLCGAFELAHTTDNEFTSHIYSRRIIDGTKYMASLRTVCDEDGYIYATAPTYTADYTDSSTKIVTTAFLNKVLSGNYSNFIKYSQARTGYLKFSNGIIINWGYCSTDSAGDSVTVTYATSFSGTTNNNIAVAQIRSSAGSNAYPIITSRTASSVTIKGDSDAVNMFIAIGY